MFNPFLVVLVYIKCFYRSFVLRTPKLLSSEEVFVSSPVGVTTFLDNLREPKEFFRDKIERMCFEWFGIDVDSFRHLSVLLLPAHVNG
jgi:hypothetical protein